MKFTSNKSRNKRLVMMNKLKHKSIRLRVESQRTKPGVYPMIFDYRYKIGLKLFRKWVKMNKHYWL